MVGQHLKTFWVAMALVCPAGPARANGVLQGTVTHV